MKELLRQPSPSVKGKRGRGLGLRLTSTHITAVLGIFTLVSSPAAAGTTTPGSAHGDKLTRWSFRPSSSTQERKHLDTGQTNFLFSKASYYRTDRMALLQICLGNLSRTDLRPRLQVPCKKDKEMHQPPTGIRPQTHLGTSHLSSGLRLGEAHRY